MNARQHVSLRYRFGNIAQAKAHVRADGDRRLFFFRDPLLRLAAGAPVTLEWTFATGDATRLLRGTALGFVEGCGVWIELLDPRPLRDLGPAPYTRRSRRLATNLEITVEGQSGPARMLDLSQGGARLTQVRDPARGRELRLGLRTGEALGVAVISWCAGGECGVRFDRRDAHALQPLLREVKEGWARAWNADHPAFCCRERGVIEPATPSCAAADTHPQSPPDPSRPCLPTLS